jgi:hypothetical protein
MLNTPRGLDFLASLHLTIFERPANFEFLNSQIAGCPKTAICCVNEKIGDTDNFEISAGCGGCPGQGPATV